MKFFISTLFLLCFTLSCSVKQSSSEDQSFSSDTIRYARGFTIQHFTDYTSVEVRDPWDSTRILQRYLLVDRGALMPGDLPKGTVVRTPVKNIVVYTSVHAAIIDQLGEADKVIGVCEPRYMDTPSIQEGLRAGKIADLGEATAPNIEKIIDIGAEIIIASPFQNAGYGPAEKLGIPIIEAADYMESLPLGRTEWIRFYGLLFGKEAMADSIFRETEDRYLELKELAKDDDRIIFTGFVQGQMLDELYSNAYIYTLPSDLEGMPLSLLEAMSYGNCCLVSDIPECAEVVEDKALIFKKSDVDELREKLQDACDYPEKVKEMKAQAADFICKKYNWDAVINETMKLYRRNNK